MKQLLFIVIISSVLFSCKKKDPPLPTTETPVFEFVGKIGNDSVNYNAGINNMFMYTGYYKDTQSLLTIRSYFGLDYCTNCEPYLSFEVKDFDVTNTEGLAGTITDLIHGGGTFNSYSLDSVFAVKDVEQFKFYPLDSNTTGGSYFWDFGDGGTSTLKNPSYIFSTGGMKTVKFKRILGGIIDSIDNQIDADFQSTCRAQFSTVTDTNNSLIVYGAPSGFTFNWTFGDGSTGVGAVANHTYLNSAKYLVTMTASSPSGCTSVFKEKVDFSFLPTTLASYRYTVADTTISGLVPRINKSAFIITWKKGGVVYKSFKNIHGLNQSGNPVFTFTSVAPYKNNANGDPTMIIKGTVDTYLYNQNNVQDSIKIESKQITLAGAYPK